MFSWLEHFVQTYLKDDMSSHRGRRRTTTFGKSVIAFSSKQGQPLEVPDLFLFIMKTTVEEGNSYTTLTSYTKDFICIPDIVGWRYIPRTTFTRKLKKNGTSKTSS